MTRNELAALSDRTKALAAERDQLVVRRESLVAEREQLYDWHLALRDSIGHNILHKRAMRQECRLSDREFGPSMESLPWTSGLAALDGRAGEQRDGPPWYLAASERARSAA